MEERFKQAQEMLQALKYTAKATIGEGAYVGITIFGDGSGHFKVRAAMTSLHDKDFHFGRANDGYTDFEDAFKRAMKWVLRELA